MRILLSVAVIFLGTIASLLAFQTFTTLPNNGNTWSSHQMMLALRKLSITLVLLAGKLSPLVGHQVEKEQIRLFLTNSS